MMASYAAFLKFSWFPSCLFVVTKSFSMIPPKNWKKKIISIKEENSVSYPRHAVSRWRVFSAELVLSVIVRSVGEG